MQDGQVLIKSVDLVHLCPWEVELLLKPHRLLLGQVILGGVSVKGLDRPVVTNSLPDLLGAILGEEPDPTLVDEDPEVLELAVPGIRDHFLEHFGQRLLLDPLRVLLGSDYSEVLTEHQPLGQVQPLVYFANLLEGRIVPKLDLLSAIVGEDFFQILSDLLQFRQAFLLSIHTAWLFVYDSIFVSIHGDETLVSVRGCLIILILSFFHDLYFFQLLM